MSLNWRRLDWHSVLPLGSGAMMVLRKGGQFADSPHLFLPLDELRFIGLGAYGDCPIAQLSSADLRLFCRCRHSHPFQGEHSTLGALVFGRKGESAVTKTLKSLPDDYVVLNDIVLPDRKGNVDHVLIGPNGVFVIETKNYSGFIKCEEDDWFVNGHRIRSLSRQAKRKQHGRAWLHCERVYGAAKQNTLYWSLC